MIFTFWYVPPPIRDRYTFLLFSAMPFYILRYIVYRRWFTRIPLDFLD
jgi:hypothetical protein